MSLGAGYKNLVMGPRTGSLVVGCDPWACPPVVCSMCSVFSLADLKPHGDGNWFLCEPHDKTVCVGGGGSLGDGVG